jgi:hypothetical protein
MTNAETAARKNQASFSTPVAIMLVLVGVFSFSAYFTLSAFAPELDEGDARAHALSRSAIGYAGIIKLARRTGAIVNIGRNEAYGASRSALVVLTPDATLSFDDVNRLGQWTVLIVLPKWIAIPSFVRPGHVMAAPTMSKDRISELIEEIAPGAAISRETLPQKPVVEIDWRETRSPSIKPPFRPGTIQELQTFAAENVTPVAKTKDGKMLLGVIRSEDAPDIYILSEPDLLNTQGIADKATAGVGLDLLNALRTQEDTITFDVTLNGYARVRNLLRLLFEPPLLAATLSFFMIASLIAWRAATREGPAAVKNRALAYGKRILADNSAALIRLAGREHTMSPRYADFIRAIVAERIGVARDGSETTNAELDRVAQARGLSQPFSTLAAEAAAAQNGVTALAAARKLHAWTEEMIRATR